MEGRRPGLDPEWLAERSSDGRFEADLRVPQHLDVWPGHFPRFFVVPGVLQVDWVVRAAAARFGAAAPTAIENLKFKVPLRPLQTFTMRLERGERGVEFRLAEGASIFSSGRLEFGGESP
jgi:3-hydroxymyristoyl/3-hydroxydecanoyl-(acyl carrier protein) dehydratase